MEQLSKVGAFAFDKTGTLTTGEPQVVESRDLDCVGDTVCAACDDLVALAYAWNVTAHTPWLRRSRPRQRNAMYWIAIRQHRS